MNVMSTTTFRANTKNQSTTIRMTSKYAFFPFAALIAILASPCLPIACETHLMVINATGRPLTGFRISPPGLDATAIPVPLPAFSSKGFIFHGHGDGSYMVAYTLTPGPEIRDTMGYLDARASFRDTLTLLPEGSAKRYEIKQSPGACGDGFHWRAFLRRTLKAMF